jgi:methylenetetrahydrofolate reductase (NADPH)
MTQAPHNPELVSALKQAYLEIIPAPGIEERLAPIPAGSYVSITCSPVHGIDPTLDLMDLLANRELKLVPHVAARVVRDKAHLRSILTRLEGAGIKSVFCPGGDAPEAVGEYQSSLQLLRDMADIGHKIEDIGVASHPEGHALIDDDALLDFLLKKQEVANYLVTQMCFDSRLLIDWLKRIRKAGVNLQAWIGLPGVADRAKLFKLSMRIGVGQSAKMLMRQKDLLKKMLQFKPYQPDELLEGLAPHMADKALDIPGFHLFSFNDIERTERWRQETIRQLEPVQKEADESLSSGEVHA